MVLLRFVQQMKLLLATYLAMSLVAFAAYAADKFKAKHAMWRTPEKVLHVMELCCGWPGALLAQKILRHKSYKPSFRSVFWLMAFINVCVVGLVVWKWR